MPFAIDEHVSENVWVSSLDRFVESSVKRIGVLLPFAIDERFDERFESSQKNVSDNVWVSKLDRFEISQKRVGVLLPFAIDENVSDNVWVQRLDRFEILPRKSGPRILEPS